MIADRLRCEVHEIEAAKPYSDDYDDTVERNVREQQADARPAIANPLRSIAQYDTALLASPIWNVRRADDHVDVRRPPRLLGQDRLPGHDLRHERPRHHRRGLPVSCTGARIGDGLAVRGEQVRESGAAVDAWLRRTELLTSERR